MARNARSARLLLLWYSIARGRQQENSHRQVRSARASPVAFMAVVLRCCGTRSRGKQQEKHSLASRVCELSAVDVTGMAIFERLYLDLGPRQVCALCHHSIRTLTPTVTLSLFLDFSLGGPSFVCQQVIWPQSLYPLSRWYKLYKLVCGL